MQKKRTASPRGLAIRAALAAMVLGLSMLAVPAAGQSDKPYTFDMPAQPLADALEQFSDTTGVDVVADAALVAQKEAPALSGEMTAGEALRRLLGDSELAHRFTGEQTVAITPQASLPSEPDSTALDEAEAEPVGEGQTQEVTVYGKAVEQGYRAERATTATRTDTPIMDLPASIQVVPRKVIDDQNAQDLREVTRNVSGVFMDNSFGGIGHDFNIRGFNQDFKLRNGFREDETAVTRTQELANVERVEVLKGPASITSGRLAPGGVINIVTKKPTAERVRRFEVEGGTTSEGGGSVEKSIDLGGPLTENGKVKYRLNALYSHRDSYREPFDQDFERFFIAPTLSFEIGPDTDLLLELEYTNDERPFDRGIIHFNGQFSDRDRNLQPESVVNDSESIIGSYTLDHHFTDNVKLRHRSQFIWLDRFNLENVPFAPATDFPGSFPNAQRGDFARFIGSNDAIETTFSTQTELHATLEGPIAEHDILAAVDFSRDEEDRVFQSSLISRG